MWTSMVKKWLRKKLIRFSNMTFLNNFRHFETTFLSILYSKFNSINSLIRFKRNRKILIKSFHTFY